MGKVCEALDLDWSCSLALVEAHAESDSESDLFSHHSYREIIYFFVHALSFCSIPCEERTIR